MKWTGVWCEIMALVLVACFYPLRTMNSMARKPWVSKELHRQYRLNGSPVVGLHNEVWFWEPLSRAQGQRDLVTLDCKDTSLTEAKISLRGYLQVTSAPADNFFVVTLPLRLPW